METLTDILIRVGNYFTDDLYFTTTKIQGIFWSLADIAIAWYMLKIADIIRKRIGKRKISRRYYFLFLSAILTIFLPVMKTRKYYFILESAIFAIQYLLFMYTVVAERKDASLYIKSIIQR